MIYKRGKTGIYWYEFMWKGKRVRESTNQRNNRVARQMEAARKTQFAKGEVGIEIVGPGPTFVDYADNWLNGHAKTNCKYSTWKSYQSVIENHLKPLFGSRRIDEITRKDVERLITKKLRRENAARSTVRNIIAPLREMLNHAVDDDELAISINPANRVGRYFRNVNAKKTRLNVNALTKPEISRLIDAATRFGFRVITESGV